MNSAEIFKNNFFDGARLVAASEYYNYFPSISYYATYYRSPEANEILKTKILAWTYNTNYIVLYWTFVL